MNTTIRRSILAFVAATVAVTGTIAPANAQQQQGKKKNPDAQPVVVRPDKNPSDIQRQPKPSRNAEQAPDRVAPAGEKPARVNPNKPNRRVTPAETPDQNEPRTVTPQRERPSRQIDRQPVVAVPDRPAPKPSPRVVTRPETTTVERVPAPRVISQPGPTTVVRNPAPVPGLPRARTQPRLPDARQRQLIVEQQNRVVVYDRRLRDQQRIAEQRARILEQQRRLAQYRFQVEYLERLRQQQMWLASQQNYNYYDDPYYYTAPAYRYYHLGSWYQINPYGANLLQQAVQYGYQEGYQAGRADRDDRWRFGFQDSWAYQDANYGYNGFYVDQSLYNYYFRQGFERGYQDGYYGRYQYGSYSHGTLAILGAVLNSILAFQSL